MARTSPQTTQRASEKGKRPASRKKAGGRWLTPAEAADRLGVTARWLRELVKQGMPREPGRAGRYPWPSCREWYTKHLEQKVIERVQPSSLTDERAAYTRTRRELAEIDLQVRQREVVEIQDVSRIWGEFLDKLRAILLSIPATWTPELLTLGATSHRTMATKLTDLRDELMTCLSGVGNEYRTPEAEKEKRNRKVKRGSGTTTNRRTPRGPKGLGDREGRSEAGRGGRRGQS